MLSHLYPVNFLMIHPNIILPSIPRCSKWSPSLRIPHQIPVYTFPLPICTTCPAHFILHDFINQTILGEDCRSLSSSLFSFLHSLLGPNILLITLFSNTLRLRFFLNVTDQVSLQGKFMFPYILSLHFWIANWKVKIVH